jgi:hypothetical protein
MLYVGYRLSLSQEELSDYGAEHPPPYSADVKKDCSNISISIFCLNDLLRGDLYLLEISSCP